MTPNGSPGSLQLSVEEEEQQQHMEEEEKKEALNNSTLWKPNYNTIKKLDIIFINTNKIQYIYGLQRNKHDNSIPLTGSCLTSWAVALLLLVTYYILE